MNKILNVILKDLKNRLSKRWFWVLSLMGPMIFTLMIIIPVGLNMKTATNKVVEVWQEPQGVLPVEELPKNEQFNYMVAHGDLDFCMSEFIKSKHDILLVIPKNLSKQEILIYENKNASTGIKKLIHQDLVTLLKLKHLTAIYTKEEIKSLEKVFSYKSIPLHTDDKGTMEMVIGIVAAIVIYYFTFSYSIQVMRNVMEEKINRVVEVILVAMKPWQLMLAKILGGSILGMIQFLVWCLLTGTILWILSSYFQLSRFTDQNIQSTLQHIQSLQHIKNADEAWEMHYIVTSMAHIDWAVIIPGILLYFVLGYILYAAMFAAIGASVDQDAETQLFIMPVTAPLALSIVFIQFVAENPSHGWTRFLTLFPFTSPVVAPIKVVTGEMALWELAASVGIMLLTIALIIYLSGKIFKTGILNYGQSATWKEILKWVTN